MSCLCILFLFILKVSFLDGRNTINSAYIDGIKDKDDIWIWGYSDPATGDRNNDGPEPNKTVTTPRNPQNKTKDPCDPFVSIKPNFTGRISEVKCQEHLWQLKYDAESQIHTYQCELSKKSEEGYKDDEREIVPEVVGGHITIPGEYPHMGAIGWRSVNDTWLFKCGGSLISDKFVLTAAHCSSASSSDTSLADTVPKIVRFMAKNLNGPINADVQISRIISHPNYKSPKKNYDIALMELGRKVNFNKLAQPACLWTKPDLKELGTATVTGWGVIRQNSLLFSEELQAGDLNVIKDEVCDQLLGKFCNRNWCGLQDHQFCAGNLSGGVDACQGDSGGPLQVKIPQPDYVSYNTYYVFGVTSFGVGCAQPDLPGIYTRVSSFLDWIEPIVWP